MSLSYEQGSQSSRSPVAEVAPTLRWDVRVRREGDAAVFERDDTEFRFDGVPVDILLDVINRFDGHATINEIAEDSAAPVNLALSIVERLLHYDLARDARELRVGDLDPEVFSGVCRQFFPVWKERLFSHPLWHSLGSGEASRAQFGGWLLESYHFIEGVNVRLSLAVAECSDLNVRPLFARHYSEEYDHSVFFLEALSAFGMSKERVLATKPLPSTLGVLNLMRQCARRDPVQYSVCSGFLESTGADRIRGRTFFEHLKKNYAVDAPGITQPLVNHLSLDEAYEHNSLMEAVCLRIGKLSAHRASKALEAGLLLVETLELWSTDIMRTYNRSDFLSCIGLNRYRSSHEQAVW